MSKLDLSWADAALKAVNARTGKILAETGAAFPLYNDGKDGQEGAWITTDDGNWCAGYWIGLLYLAASHAGTESERGQFVAAAQSHLERFLTQPTGHLFAGMNHYYAGYFGCDILGKEDLRSVGQRGADAMLALFNPAARHIPIGLYTTAPAPPTRTDRTPVDRSNFAAVDAIHTSIPVLLRAHSETGDAVYLDTALAHIRKHLEWHVRPDGSTSQMTVFNPVTGMPERTFSTLAATDAGCWSRGLAWHIAGLVHAYEITGEEWLLPPLVLSCAYYEAKADRHLLPAWDLEVDDLNAPRDASAAAVIAYGLIRLAARPNPAAAQLQSLGIRILQSLIANCMVLDCSAPNFGAVTHGCYRFKTGIAVDNELIWTDFYTAAALHALCRDFGPELS